MFLFSRCEHRVGQYNTCRKYSMDAYLSSFNIVKAVTVKFTAYYVVTNIEIT